MKNRDGYVNKRNRGTLAMTVAPCCSAMVWLIAHLQPWILDRGRWLDFQVGLSKSASILLLQMWGAFLLSSLLFLRLIELVVQLKCFRERKLSEAINEQYLRPNYKEKPSNNIINCVRKLQFNTLEFKPMLH